MSLFLLCESSKKIVYAQNHGGGRALPLALPSHPVPGDFSRRKIVYPNMAKFMPFMLDDGGCVSNVKCSSLFKCCFRDALPELQGGTREVGKVFFDKIPVARVTDETEVFCMHCSPFASPCS